MMKKSTLWAILVLVSAALLMGGCGNGEGEPTPTPGDGDGNGKKPPAPAIMECIPAGSSYIVTNSIAKTIDTAEMFLIDIGVGEMLGIGVSRPGDGRGPRSVLLDMIKQQLKLGKGFDPKGGAAFVVLDPRTVGIDLVKLLDESSRPGRSPSASKAEDMSAVIAPGTLETIFANAKPTNGGALTVIKPHGKELWAAQKGAYVVISPSGTAVKAILDAKKTAAAELSADEIALINGSELTMHFNVKPYRSVAGKLLDELKKNLEKEVDKPTAAGLGVYLMMARELIGQVDATTLGVKLGQNGVNIDSITTAAAGSVAAKVFAAESATPGGAKVLDSLPSLPYVMAMGSNGWMNNPALHDAMMDLSKAMMGPGPDALYKVDEKTKARMIELQNEMAGMITGVQLVVGGAPKGKGMVNLAYVIRCKDSAKYRGIFPESIELTNKMLAGMEMPPDAPKVSMTYTKDAEKVDGVSVDSMNILLSKVPGDDKNELPNVLKMVLGEETIRIRIATPDAKTMVMTIGGSTEAMSQTLKVCAGKGPIPAMPSTAAVMRNLPENPSMVALFNMGNLLDVIRTGMKAAGAPPEIAKMIPPFKCRTPIAFGARTKGATLQTGLYLSKPMIKESVQVVMAAVAAIMKDLQQTTAKQWNTIRGPEPGNTSQPGSTDF